MKAGNFNIYNYLDKLNEEAEMAEKSTAKVDSLGLIIPDTNTKSYNWLKSEYQKGKTEVKVEMNMGGAKFEPGYDMQGNVKTTDTFKPGMYGEVKTTDTDSTKKDVSTNVEPKKSTEDSAEKTDKSEDTKAAVKSKKPDTDSAEKKPDVKGKTLNFDLKTKKNDKS